jgi:hypothetical protein
MTVLGHLDKDRSMRTSMRRRAEFDRYPGVEVCARFLGARGDPGNDPATTEGVSAGEVS